MSYMHIENLYKNQDILLFKECFALEKIHGTSAHVAWHDAKISFSSGAASLVRFTGLFDEAKLRAGFESMGHESVTIYGEAYGGSVLKQSWRYGKELKFIVFDVRVGELWLSVPNAAEIAALLGLEFVHYKKISTDLAAIDAERDAPSEQAKRNGVDGEKRREGIVLRPLIELRKNNDDRIIAKHKGPEERETATEREVDDPARLEVLSQAGAIADEWVTVMRLTHVLDKLGPAETLTLARTGDVVKAMTENVLREGQGEIVDSKEARQAIGRRAAELFKARLKEANG